MTPCTSRQARKRRLISHHHYSTSKLYVPIRLFIFMPYISFQIAWHCVQWGLSALDFSGKYHSLGHQVCVCTNVLIPFQRKPRYGRNKGSASLTSNLFALNSQDNGCKEHHQRHNHLGFWSCCDTIEQILLCN